MSSTGQMNHEMVDEVNQHFNSISDDLETIKSDIKEIAVIEEREAKELSPKGNIESKNDIKYLKDVLNSISEIQTEGISSIAKLNERENSGVIATVSYIRFVGHQLVSSLLDVLQAQIEFEADVENIYEVRKGETELSETQNEYIRSWANDCLEILEELERILETILEFGENMLEKYGDNTDKLLSKTLDDYKGGDYNLGRKKIKREKEELEELLHNIE